MGGLQMVRSGQDGGGLSTSVAVVLWLAISSHVGIHGFVAPLQAASTWL